jgi:hypothetical protein
MSGATMRWLAVAGPLNGLGNNQLVLDGTDPTL